MFPKLHLKITTIIFCTFAYLPLSWAENYQLQDLEIIQPWSRATLNGAKVAGAYAKIINKGDNDDRLIGVETALTDKAQIHSSEMVDGVMKMRHQPNGIIIPAHGEIELKPMSYHIMLMDIKHGLVLGETLAAKLIFEKSGSIALDFTIAPMGARSPAKD